MYKSTRFLTRVQDLFSADVRSLALLRVGVAVALIAELIIRALSIDFYSDSGILTRANVGELYNWEWLSLHSLSGEVSYQAFLFLLSIVFALMLLVGYRTKLATTASFVLMVSMWNRDPFVDMASATLLRLILFWGIFMPWNARFSVDSINHPDLKKIPNRIFSMGAVGYFIQIASLYFFAVAYKTGPEWTRSYTAVYYALSYNMLASPFGSTLLQLPQVALKVLTVFVRLLEIFTPFLLFFPYKNQIVRLFGVVLLFFTQIGFGLSFLIGLFPIVNIVSLFGLLPTIFWDKLTKIFDRKSSLKIYYELDCGLCSWIVSCLKTFFLFPNVEVIPSERDPAIYSLMKKENSWVIVYKGKKYFRAEAVVPIMKNSPLMFPFLPLTLIPGIFNFGNIIYNFISKRRHTICKVPRTKERKSTKTLSLLISCFCFVVIIYTLLININWLTRGRVIPANLVWIAPVFGISQRWDMFAPSPPLFDRQLLVEGTLANRNKVYLLPETPKTFLWSNYIHYQIMRRRLTTIPNHHIFYAQYLCKKWNGKKGQSRLTNIDMTLILRKTLLPGQRPESLQNVSLLKYECES